MTYIVKASVKGYDQDSEMVEAINAMGADKWKAIGDELLFGDEWPKYDRVKDQKYWSVDLTVTIDNVVRLQDHGFMVNVGRVKGLDYSAMDPVQMVKTASNLSNQFHMHVPGGVALTSIDHVTYEEDCCTDRLERMLNEGWRIIAVCPPNDARRPTYILGRTGEAP